MSFFIEYPDTVAATGNLISIIGPKEIKAKCAGKIDTLFYKDGDTVKSMAVLGYIESIANIHDVIAVSGFLNNMPRDFNFQRSSLSLSY